MAATLLSHAWPSLRSLPSESVVVTRSQGQWQGWPSPRLAQPRRAFHLRMSNCITQQHPPIHLLACAWPLAGGQRQDADTKGGGRHHR